MIVAIVISAIPMAYSYFEFKREQKNKDGEWYHDILADYEDYALLQDKQGMPLREYAGEEAQLYVYEVKNYSPESRKMLAELLVCDNTAVASMVYSDGADYYI